MRKGDPPIKIDESNEGYEADLAFEAADLFLKAGGSDEVWGKWNEDYQKNPDAFFSPDNTEYLHGMPAGKRLLLLAYTLHDLRIEHETIDEYFERFPEDIQAAEALFATQRGVPETLPEHELFIATAPFFADDIKGQDSDRERLGQYLEIAERRNLAPEHLLEGFKPGLGDQLEKFGKAVEGFKNSWDEAAELSIAGNHFIDPEQMFTEEYRALPSGEQAEILRIFLSHLQYALVFEEVYNSVFTKESVESRDGSFRDSSRQSWGGDYNVAHSMLFGTRQPQGAFEAPQDYFKWQMESTADSGGDIEEYAYHRLLLTVLREFQDIEADQDDNTDTLVDFWSKNRNPLFANALADALSMQNANHAAGRLLEQIQGESKDKHSLAVILYRLELGQIGISKEGVQYLERLYDLGEYNNPDFFVRRLSGEGEMGVFGNEKELLGYFKLGDLTGGRSGARAEVLELTYEMLFMPQERESEEERERREKILGEFKSKYFTFYDDDFFKSTRVHFNNLPLREQGWFMHFAGSADTSKKAEAIEFVERYGENGMRTFLSLEYGDAMGDTILSLGDGTLSEVVAQSVFDTYARIADSARGVAEYMALRVSSDLSEAELVTKVRDRLLLKGKGFLKDLEARKILFAEDTSFEVGEGIARRLRGLHEGVLLFGAVFKEISKEQKGIKLEDIEGTEIASLLGSELTKEMKAEMNQFFLENRKGVFPEDLLSENALIFNKQLEDAGARFYILRHDGKMVGFLRYSNVEDGSVEATSMNVDPHARGFALGGALFTATLLREGRSLVKGTVLADSKETLKTYQQLGFEIVGERTVRTSEGNEYLYYDIERPRGK